MFIWPRIKAKKRLSTPFARVNNSVLLFLIKFLFPSWWPGLIDLHSSCLLHLLLEFCSENIVVILGANQNETSSNVTPEHKPRKDFKPSLTKVCSYHSSAPLFVNLNASTYFSILNHL